MQSGTAETAVSEIEAAFATLYVADTVEFDADGTGAPSHAARAFRTIEATGHTHRGRIQWLLEHANPAGKVYAATLLAKLDAQAGVQAWQTLATQSGTYVIASACFGPRPARVSDYAQRELQKLGASASEATRMSPGLPPRAKLGDHPLVDSDQARRAINEALLGRPRAVLVTAHDESHFVNSLFGEHGNVYVARKTLDEAARGPHFDMYQSMVDPAFPFMATFNLAGEAIVHSTELDPDLASYYLKHHRKPSEDADAARRLVGGLALRQPGMRTEHQNLPEGAGMVIPQRPGALPVVHDVQPTEQSDGTLLRFIVPMDDYDALAAVAEEGFRRWHPGDDWDDAATTLA